MRRVLFISHNASRTGAPFLLLQVLRWLRANTDWHLEIVLRESGPLLEEFKAIGPTFVFDNERPLAVSGVNWLSRFRRRLDLRARKSKLISAGFDLVFSNTATNGIVLDFLSALKCPVISSIHELQYDLTTVVSAENKRRLFNRTDLFIAGSEAARQNLIWNHQVNQEKVKTLHDFISVDQYPTPLDGIGRQKIKAQLGIAAETLLVCAAGTITWRKGPDLFVQLALHTHAMRPDLQVHFLWIGANPGDRDFVRLQHDIQFTGLSDRLTLLPATSDYLQYIESSDIFTLMSREDCFPLVMLEAALRSKPILCFEGGGGGPEFVGTDAGLTAPYLNTAELARRVIELCDDEERRTILGRNAQVKVLRDHDVAQAATQIKTTIERIATTRANVPAR